MPKYPILNEIEYFIDDEIKKHLEKNKSENPELQTKALACIIIKNIKQKYGITEIDRKYMNEVLKESKDAS